METWKPIKDYENQYEVSDLGRVKRLAHYVTVEANQNQATASKRFLKEIIMQTALDEFGYPLVTLKRKTFRLARVVAEAFLEKPEKASFVRNRNKDTLDCRVENLYWDVERTPEEKHETALRNGRKYNKNPRRRIWYKQREKHPDYLAYQRNPETRYTRAKNNSRKEFNVSKEFYIDVISKPCYYCFKSLSNETGSGLDRIDNNKGYLEDNVLPCCGNCNSIRSNKLTVEEMQVAMKAILKWREDVKEETRKDENSASTGKDSSNKEAV